METYDLDTEERIVDTIDKMFEELRDPKFEIGSQPNINSTAPDLTERPKPVGVGIKE